MPPDRKIVEQSLIILIEGLLIATIDKAIDQGIKNTGIDPGEELEIQHENIMKSLEEHSIELNAVLLHMAWIMDEKNRKFFMETSLEMKRIFYEKVFKGEEIKPIASLKDTVNLSDYINKLTGGWKPLEVIDGEQEWPN